MRFRAKFLTIKCYTNLPLLYLTLLDHWLTAIQVIVVAVLDVATAVLPLLPEYRRDTACPTETAEVTEVHSPSLSSQTVQHRQRPH